MERLRALRKIAQHFARRTGPPCALLVATCLPAGCADTRFLNRNAPQPPPFTDSVAPDPRYRVGCPDVLEVSFHQHPEWDAYIAINLDGQLPITDSCRPRIEGMTLAEVRTEVAKRAGVAESEVEVSLASPRSGRLFVNGPVRGRSRCVADQGPENVIGFLTRIGGLPPGSKLSEVYVVRPHVAVGQPPEVFTVDVQAVLVDGNQSTNIPLRESDQIYIGETRGSTFSRSLPHWMGTMYRRFTGLLPDLWRQFERTPGG